MILRKLRHEYIFRFFVLDKLVDHLHEARGFHLITKLCDQLQTLVEVEHVHVGEYSFLLLLHDANPNGVHAYLVHVFLEVGDLIGI